MAATLRFAAGLRPLLGQVFRASVPQTGRDLLADAGMNVLMAGMSAAALPEGTSAGLRAGAFAEDLLTSVPISWAGRGLGYAGVRGFGRMRGRPLSPENAALAQNLAGGGAEMGLWMTGLVPRPFASEAITAFNRRMEADQMEQLAMREQEIRNRTIAEMGGAGLLMAPLQQSLGWDPYGSLG